MMCESTAFAAHEDTACIGDISLSIRTMAYGSELWNVADITGDIKTPEYRFAHENGGLYEVMVAFGVGLRAFPAHIVCLLPG